MTNAEKFVTFARHAKGTIKERDGQFIQDAAKHQLEAVGPTAPIKKELLEPASPIEHLRAVLGIT